MPSWSCSSRAHAAPRARSSRPWLAWSTVIACAASTDGCRYVTPVTSRPSRIDVVIPAQSGQGGHALEALAGAFAVHRLEVIEAPHPGEAEIFGQPGPGHHLVERHPLLGDVQPELHLSSRPGRATAAEPPCRRTGSRSRPGRWPRRARPSRPRSRCSPAAAQIGLQLLERTRAEDRRGDARPVGEPGQRHLGHRHAAVLGDLLHGVDDPPGAFGAAPVPGLHPAVRVLAEPGGAGGPLVAAVLARQPAAAQRAPRQQAEAGVDGGGHDLPLDLPDEQAVLRLQRHRGRQVRARGPGARPWSAASR